MQMTKTRSTKKTNPHPQRGSATGRSFLLFLIPWLVFSVGFIPVLISVKLLLMVITFDTWMELFILPFVIILELLFLLISEVLISGVVIRLFNITYSEGTYEYTLQNKTAFKWMLYCQLYTPMRKLLEIIPLGYLNKTYLRLVGMKIGKNTLVGGTIKDPCVTEIGDNVTMGEYAIIYAHIHDYSQGTITIKKVTINNDCVIGAGAIIMPGVTLQEGACLGAGALVPKNKVLEQKKIYGGNPAKEISPQQKKTGKKKN